MAARRGLLLLPSLARVGEHLSLHRASRTLLPSIQSFSESSALQTHQILATRYLWNGWKLGFSSSSSTAQNEKDESQKYEGSETSHDQQNASTTEQTPSAEPEETEPELTPEELRAALEKYKENFVAEKKKAEEFKDKLIRTLADMENLRERTARQTAEAKQFAVQSFLKSLVDVADNLERAAGSISIEDVDGTNEIELDRALSLLRSLRDGVILTDGILMKILEKEGVTRYDPLGQPFDPNLHMALFQVPDATKEPGSVAVVVKKGYLLHDRAVRAAEVGVATAVSEPES